MQISSNSYDLHIFRRRESYLHIEDSINATVLPLPGKPALAQEEEDLLRVLVHHLHLVQVPVGAHHAIVVAYFDLVHLSEVNRLYGELIHLREGKTMVTDESTYYYGSVSLDHLKGPIFKSLLFVCFISESSGDNFNDLKIFTNLLISKSPFSPLFTTLQKALDFIGPSTEQAEK